MDTLINKLDYIRLVFSDLFLKICSCFRCSVGADASNLAGLLSVPEGAAQDHKDKAYI